MNHSKYTLEVAVCTWNRSASLERLLKSFLCAEPPLAGTWRLIIVDNNSTDDTRAVISKYESQLPISYVFEARQGVSFARNCVLAESTADLLLCTDDDVVVPRDWIKRYEQIATEYPDADYFGGPIIPVFDAPIQPWANIVLRTHGWVWAYLDHGRHPFWLSDDQVIFGANMAFRTSKFENFRFNTDLGRNGKQQLGGEETDFVNTLRRAGHRGLWIGTPPVQHQIPKERTTIDALWQASFGFGRSEARIKNGSLEDYILRSRLHLFVWFFVSQLSALYKRHLWVHSYIRYAYWSGFLSEIKDK